MSNQRRDNDHLFNKLFVAYAEVYMKNTYTYSINLRDIVDNSKPRLETMVLEYYDFINRDSAYRKVSKKDIVSGIPSGSSIKNYSDDLYDYNALPHQAEDKCRILLRAIYQTIYKEGEGGKRLSAVKDTIADVIHETRELYGIDAQELRKWIDDLDHIYFLIDLALISSYDESRKAVKELVNRVLSKDNDQPQLPPIQFILGSADTNTMTNMQNTIIDFRNNLRRLYADEMFSCRVTRTSTIQREYQNRNFSVSIDEKYVFVLDYNVSNEDELVYQLLKRGTGSRYPLLEIWMKDNAEQHGRQNDSAIRLLKDANEQGFRINTYKDITDIIFDVFSNLVKNDINLAERDIRITNAHLYVDGKEILSLEHSSPYNSAQAELLNNRISDLTEQLQDHIEESINILERIELCRSQLQGYKDSMDEILTMLICNRNSQNSDLSKFQSVSFWGSDSESARKELDDPQWKRIREKGEKSIDKGRQRLEEYMESRFLLIQILQSQICEDDRVSNKDAVRKLYDELEGLSLKYNIRHDMIFKYADYLNRISLYDECISKSERLLKLCEIYEDNENLHDRACILLGDAYKAVGKYEESFDYLDRVLNKDYDRTSKIRLHAIVSKLGGMILTHDMKSFGPLLATIPKSVLQETYEEPDMTMIQARIYHDQGAYYSSNSEFKTAIDSYENAIRLYKSLSEKYEKDSLKAAEIADRMTRSINNLSGIYLFTDNYNLDLAESGYMKALEITEKYSAPHLFPRIFEPKKTIYMLRLALIMKERNEYADALRIVSDVIHLRSGFAENNTKYRRGLMFARIQRADLYMEMNELELAKADLDEVENIMNDKDTDNSSATIEVRCSYYSSLAIWKLIKKDRQRKKQYDLAIKYWDEFATMSSVYASRKKNEFIRRYDKILSDQTK